MKIGIIGCGHMGSAFAEGLLSGCDCELTKTSAQKEPPHLWLANPSKPKLQIGAIGKKHSRWVTKNSDVVKNASVIIIAVKPQVVKSVLTEIAPHLQPNHLLISIATGIPLKKLSLWSNGHKKIVRAMPNLAASIGHSMTVWKGWQGLSKKEKKIVTEILNSVGFSTKVHKENLIDMATVLSGGAPAYCAAFLESMARVGEKSGFSPKAARNIALDAILGAVYYMQESDLPFSTVKTAVQTKGGTTEAGFKVLIRKKWQKILEDAFAAGYKRAQKIGR